MRPLPLLRRSFRSTHHRPRFASTDAAGAAHKKAPDALGTIGKTADTALETTKRLLGTLGEGLGNVLGKYRQPVFYNLSVARELLKQVYLAEGLQPPTSLHTIQNAYATLWSRASNIAYWRQIASNGEIARVGIYALEAYGLFKIGEIIGRRSLVGYNVH